MSTALASDTPTNPSNRYQIRIGPKVALWHVHTRGRVGSLQPGRLNVNTTSTSSGPGRSVSRPVTTQYSSLRSFMASTCPTTSSFSSIRNRCIVSTRVNTRPAMFRSIDWLPQSNVDLGPNNCEWWGHDLGLDSEKPPVLGGRRGAFLELFIRSIQERNWYRNQSESERIRCAVLQLEYLLNSIDERSGVSSW